jgi:AcrR family transcriptional regulator
MESVRARAGVGKATVYRRWTGKAELVKAAIRVLHQDLDVPEDSGSVMGDLAAVASSGATAAEATGAGWVVPRLLADASDDPELRDIFYESLVAPRREVLSSVLERGIARGEVRADADLDVAMDLLVGAIVYRGLISGVEPEHMEERFAVVVAMLIAGLRPRG